MAYGRRSYGGTRSRGRAKTGYRSYTTRRRSTARSTRRSGRAARTRSASRDIRLVIVQEPATPVARPFTAEPAQTEPKKGKF